MGKVTKLIPAPSYKIWGGEKLSKIKNLSGDLPLGETWEISTHSAGPSKIVSQNLSDLCSLSYLFKFIDTNDNLSVQVHPDDKYAKEHEGDSGKTECWIILDSEPGAGIYLGFKSGITRKEFKTAIENGLSVEKYLNYFEVKPGDYFYVPVGTIHAIGKGVTLAEAQQSSGVTYRVWDWNRLDDQGNSRELHIDKAMDVINFSEDFNQSVIKNKTNLFNQSGMNKVIEHEDFKVHLLSIRKDEQKEIRMSAKEGISILSGHIDLDGEAFSKYESGICIDEGLVQLKAKENSYILFITE
jgi:mannose-6-phosphate isomerase